MEQQTKGPIKVKSLETDGSFWELPVMMRRCLIRTISFWKDEKCLRMIVMAVQC